MWGRKSRPLGGVVFYHQLLCCQNDQKALAWSWLLTFAPIPSASTAFHTKDLRDLLPEIVSYVFSLGGWAEDHEHLGFWCPWAKGAGGGAHLVELLGARGPLMQHLIRDSKDANLIVWPQWTERDMPARVFRLHRNPRLAPFQGGTSRFLAMWVP